LLISSLGRYWRALLSDAPYRFCGLSRALSSGCFPKISFILRWVKPFALFLSVFKKMLWASAVSQSHLIISKFPWDL
jgi:hypothetical protein